MRAVVVFFAVNISDLWDEKRQKYLGFHNQSHFSLFYASLLLYANRDTEKAIVVVDELRNWKFVQHYDFQVYTPQMVKGHVQLLTRAFLPDDDNLIKRFLEMLTLNWCDVKEVSRVDRRDRESRREKRNYDDDDLDLFSLEDLIDSQLLSETQGFSEQDPRTYGRQSHNNMSTSFHGSGMRQENSFESHQCLLLLFELPSS